MIWTDFLLVIFLGGLFGLDTTSVAQTMISRPIAASTIVGCIFGSPESGIMIGALLEMLALETMPFGASRYLDWSCGAVVGAVVVSRHGGISAPVVLTAVIFALISAWLAGASTVAMRKVNGRNVAARRAALETGDASVLLTIQATGVGLDFVRGSVVTAAAALLAFQAGDFITTAVEKSGQLNIGIIVAVPTAVCLAACWRIFGSRSRRRYLMVVGALIGVALVAAQ